MNEYQELVKEGIIEFTPDGHCLFFGCDVMLVIMACGIAAVAVVIYLVIKR